LRQEIKSIPTISQKYGLQLKAAWPANNETFFGANPMRTLLKAIPYMNDDYKNDLRAQVLVTRRQLDSIANVNPYGVPLGQGGFYSPGGRFFNRRLVTYQCQTSSVFSRYH
jgi:endoglucanase